MTRESATSSINLNTILITIVLGVMSWLGYTANSTQVAVAVIAEKAISMTEKAGQQEREILDLRGRMAIVEITLERLKRNEGK